MEVEVIKMEVCFLKKMEVEVKKWKFVFYKMQVGVVKMEVCFFFNGSRSCQNGSLFDLSREPIRFHRSL